MWARSNRWHTDDGIKADDSHFCNLCGVPYAVCDALCARVHHCFRRLSSVAKVNLCCFQIWVAFQVDYEHVSRWQQQPETVEKQKQQICLVFPLRLLSYEHFVVVVVIVVVRKQCIWQFVFATRTSSTNIQYIEGWRLKAHKTLQHCNHKVQ